MRGSEAILGSQSHIHYYEQGGISQIGGIHTRIVKNEPDGVLTEAVLRGGRGEETKE